MGHDRYAVATAWYADRCSLWLPDSLSDFEKIHDDICPSGVLLFTPVTWDKPLFDLVSGEDKDWSFIVAGAPPSDFPLKEHIMTPPGGPDYSIWSDRPRWQQR